MKIPHIVRPHRQPIFKSFRRWISIHLIGVKPSLKHIICVISDHIIWLKHRLWFSNTREGYLNRLKKFIIISIIMVISIIRQTRKIFMHITKSLFQTMSLSVKRIHIKISYCATFKIEAEKTRRPITAQNHFRGRQRGISPSSIKKCVFN